MSRAIEPCHAWLEALVYRTQASPDAIKDPELGADIALLKVQAGQVSSVRSCRIYETSVLGSGVVL